jgi:tetratricopeptide (TPR) repeat protein
MMKVLFAFLFLAANLFAQKRTNTEIGFSYFLAGDTKTAYSYLTKAIASDTLIYEAYYFRGIISLRQDDTLATINDFDQALRLKLAGQKPCKDSLLRILMEQKPKRGPSICTFEPNSGLFNLQLATWHILEEVKQEKARELFKAEALEIKAASVLYKRIHP